MMSRNKKGKLALFLNPFHISIALLGIATVAVLGLRLYFIYSTSPNLGGMETSIVYGLQQVLADMPLYSDPEAAPFAIIQYSPLYYYLVGTLGKLFSIDPDQPRQVFVLSRWAGLLFNLVGLFVLATILKELQLQRKWKVIAILLAWLCLEPAHYARPDSLQSLFFLTFVWAGLRYLNKESWLALFWTVLAATLACWSKQNGILLPIFLLFYLFFIKKQILHACSAGAMVLILNAILWFIWVEDSNLFLANIIQGVDNGTSLIYFFSAIIDSGVKKFAPFFIMGLYLALVGIFFPAGKQSRFLSWLLGATFAFASLTALKWGSIPSYFTDFIHLSLIAGTWWLADFFAKHDRGISSRASLFYALILGAILLLQVSGKEWGRVLQEDQSDWFAQAEQVRDDIQRDGLQPEQYIFTHDYLINLFLFRHCLFPQNDIVYCCTAPRKTYDYSDFAADVKAGHLRYVIDWKAERPRPFLNVEFEKFDPKQTIGRYRIWEKNPPLTQ